nr:immunoglobulin light chain junction region [Macaca mulatta]
CQHGYGTTPTF